MSINLRYSVASVIENMFQKFHNDIQGQVSGRVIKVINITVKKLTIPGLIDQDLMI